MPAPYKYQYLTLYRCGPGMPGPYNTNI